jgi:hypothetical protein
MRSYGVVLLVVSALAFGSGMITGMNFERSVHPFAPEPRPPAVVPSVIYKTMGCWA